MSDTNSHIWFISGLFPETAPGHLHQGGICISRGGTNHVVCVGGGSVGKRAICDRVQLLTLAKVCNRFLMCAVLSVSLSHSKSITFSKEGRGWKVGGTVTHLGGYGPQMPPLGANPAYFHIWMRPKIDLRILKSMCFFLLTRLCVISNLCHIGRKKSELGYLNHVM